MRRGTFEGDVPAHGNVPKHGNNTPVQHVWQVNASAIGGRRKVTRWCLNSVIADVVQHSCHISAEPGA